MMLQTGAQLGPYRLLRRIGAGGMAEVFLAQRIGAEGFARTVAIKTILAVGAEEEGISLFLDEARVAGYLEHPAIVQTVDLGFENDTLFIVMEYVPGPAVSRVIRDLKKLNRFLSPEVVAYIGAKIASALDYAHRRATTPDGTFLKLVHRDISPQNIMITRNGMAKLTDFGVARASVQTHRTRTGQVRGKAAYMAPEQVRAGQLDGRTDIFALALVLYESLTGVRAYQRKTDIMSMRAILTDEIAPIHDVNPNVPDDLVAVIKKALAKKPDDRYANAAEMTEALQLTYRSHSEAAIESEITAVINELFGPEQFEADDQGMPVEAWQPTISANAEGEGSNPTPHRISGAKLSPKIAALLQTPTPSSSMSSAREPATPGDGYLDTPAMMTPTPSSARNVAFSGVALRAAEEAKSLPGAPVMGQTNPKAAPQPSEAMMSPTGVMIPTGTMHRAELTASGASRITKSTPPQPNNRVMIATAVAIGVPLLGALGVLLWPREPPPTEIETVNTPVEVRASSIEEAPKIAAQPSKPVLIQPDEPAQREQEREPERDRRRPKRAKQVEAAPAPEPQPPPKASEEHSDRDRLLLRAMTALRRVQKGSDLHKDLTRVVIDLQAGREITRADVDLVRKAEGN